MCYNLHITCASDILSQNKGSKYSNLLFVIINLTNHLALRSSAWNSCFVFLVSHIQISTSTPDILTDRFRGISQFLQANALV
jgi:hypothetical protein